MADIDPNASITNVTPPRPAAKDVTGALRQRRHRQRKTVTLPLCQAILCKLKNSMKSSRA